MDISFSLNLSLPYYKDIWGYKSDTPTPYSRVGFINADGDVLKIPTSRELFSESDICLQDFLGGKPVIVNVNVNVGGCVKKEILSTPGALTINIEGNQQDINIRLLDYRPKVLQQPSFGGWRPSKKFLKSEKEGVAVCEIQLIRDIPELRDHQLYRPTGGIHLGAVKLMLDNPGKYYASRRGRFLTDYPGDFDQLVEIYDREKDINAPAGEQVTINPLQYIGSQNPIVAKLAKAFISGDIEMYTGTR